MKQVISKLKQIDVLNERLSIKRPFALSCLIEVKTTTKKPITITEVNRYGLYVSDYPRYAKYVEFEDFEMLITSEDLKQIEATISKLLNDVLENLFKQLVRKYVLDLEISQRLEYKADDITFTFDDFMDTIANGSEMLLCEVSNRLCDWVEQTDFITDEDEAMDVLCDAKTINKAFETLADHDPEIPAWRLDVVTLANMYMCYKTKKNVNQQLDNYLEAELIELYQDLKRPSYEITN